MIQRALGALVFNYKVGVVLSCAQIRSITHGSTRSGLLLPSILHNARTHTNTGGSTTQQHTKNLAILQHTYAHTVSSAHVLEQRAERGAIDRLRVKEDEHSEHCYNSRWPWYACDRRPVSVCYKLARQCQQGPRGQAANNTR